jgi:hypothetical protein
MEEKVNSEEQKKVILQIEEDLINQNINNQNLSEEENKRF